MLRVGGWAWAALGAIALGLLARGRGASPPAPPVPPAPSDPIDPWGTRADLATGCEPVGPRPGVEAFRAWVLARRGGRDGGIWRACDVGGASEHHEGRAWDWMTSVDAGRELTADLLAGDAELARRAGVLYLIHDRRIWRAYDPRGWAPYTGPNPHTDHVHLSFTRAGAAGSSSFYSTGEGAAFLPRVIA